MTLFTKAMTTAAAASMAVLGGCTANGDMMMPPATTAATTADVATAPMTTLSASARDYAMMTASSNMLEIQKSQLALQRTSNDTVRRFAQMMITDHSRLMNDAAPVLRQLGLDPAQMQMVPKHQQLLQQLQAAPADRFDRMYHDIQATAHQEALALQRNYLANGDNPQLRAIAARAEPVIAMHIEQLREHGRHMTGM